MKLSTSRILVLSLLTAAFGFLVYLLYRGIDLGRALGIALVFGALFFVFGLGVFGRMRERPPQR